MYGEQKSMESNKPVGGEQPELDTQQTATPPAEAANGANQQEAPMPTSPSQNQPDQATSDTGRPPDSPASIEHRPDVEQHGESHASRTDSAEQGAQVQVSPDSPMQSLLTQDEPQVKKGDILEGTIAQTTPTEILVDLPNTKSPGVISGKELERMDRETLDRLKVGETVLVYVLTPENNQGHIVLSLTRALEEQDWRKAEELRESGELFQGKVDGYNKGGLIVRFGRVRGFVPESQVSRDRRRRASEGKDPQEKWAQMRGEDILVKVLEVDRSRNRLILSEREAGPQMREQQKDKLLDELMSVTFVQAASRALLILARLSTWAVPMVWSTSPNCRGSTSHTRRKSLRSASRSRSK